jgi:hypothetical protein
MNGIIINTVAAQQSLSDSLQLMAEGKNEQVIRDSFTSHLRQIFPDSPSWVVRHIQGSEAAVKIIKGTKSSTGFVDNLVDLTAIEYEGDLTIISKYNTGYNQVKDYCSSLVNQGHDPELILGILSDTVRWYAYEIDLTQLPQDACSRANIILNQIEFIDCSAVSKKTANDLTSFLLKYLGRIGARPVSAFSIAKDLGFESRFCEGHIASLSTIVKNAFSANPKYAKLISDLWCSFVSYLREEGKPDQFDFKTYVDEYYILILGKLICANYLEQRALSSDDTELSYIINGIFFENKGLINFVEYDYFGWINSQPHIASIIPIARTIQQDLIAYDFNSNPSEDLFGNLMAQLANRSQRLLLGQEWTPGWLSHKLVARVVSGIAPAEPLRLIDMCCGSGSMIVETIGIAKKRILSANGHLSKENQIHLLTQSITGFDIDPLAVMLSKINWVLAAKDWIQPLGAFQISIPVYHADSLFAITPISNNIDDADKNVYSLRIAEYSIDLPDYLISPKYRDFFDSLIDVTYRIVVSSQNETSLSVSREDIIAQIDAIKFAVSVDFDESQIEEVFNFFSQLISKIDALNRDGRNGIWAYILRNSFRPGLVLGQFNGLVSNPPWLALSKVANNPYQVILKKMAEDFDIKPSGSSHLHIELATIFLLYAIQQYLVDGAQIGCIVPDTILNGHHHNPFRKFQFVTSNGAVPFEIDEIWKVQEHLFKNNAVVLFGNKNEPNINSVEPFKGQIVFENQPPIEIFFYKNKQGNRTAWSENELKDDAAGFYVPANFRQGADIMPRNLLFYEVTPTENPLFFNIRSINPITSNIAFTVKDAKKHQDFKISQRIMPSDLFFDVITSNLLTPFDIAEFQKALLPIEKNITNEWKVLSNADIIAMGAIVRNTFDSICRTIDPQTGNINALFSLIDTRGKLTQQIISPTGYIVMTGAGGGKVCSGYINIQNFDASRLIFDQTVYWTQVTTEDEAIYLTGLLNSDAISSIIKDFQPRGAFGERHVHKLPFGVTPPFDPMQAAHQDVVEKTKNLITEYQQLKISTPAIKEILNPNSGALSKRRRSLLFAIKNLSSYNEYEEACIALYGL